MPADCVTLRREAKFMHSDVAARPPPLPPLLDCLALHDLAPRKELCARCKSIDFCANSLMSPGECQGKREGQFPCVYRDATCRRFIPKQDTVTHCRGAAADPLHRLQKPTTALGEQHVRSAFIAYLSSVYRENASAFQHADLEALRSSLGWVYHQAHWSYSPEVAAPNQTGWPHPPRWLDVRCVAIYSGYPSPLDLSHTDHEGGDAIFFAVPHLLSLYNAYGFMVGAGQYTCAVLRTSGVPRERIRDGRVEVMRSGGGPTKYEQGLSGCWYYAMPGSGIFLDLGRTLVAQNRSHLGELLGLGRLHTTSLHLHTRPPNSKNWTDLQREMERNTPYDFEQRVDICRFARPLGYDTVQLIDESCTSSRFGGRRKHPTEMASLEIVSCHAGCVGLVTRKPRADACIPGEPLFTGVAATRPCLCDEAYPLLNCHRTPAPAGAHPKFRVPFGFAHGTSTPLHDVRLSLTKSTPMCGGAS